MVRTDTPVICKSPYAECHYLFVSATRFSQQGPLFPGLSRRGDPIELRLEGDHLVVLVNQLIEAWMPLVFFQKRNIARLYLLLDAES